MSTIALELVIENEASLPDGGPLTYRLTGERGADIGRDAHLDWTLPDPTRHISSKHCEVRFKGGGYWLYDVSTNGVFLNGDDHRMQSPYRLRSGDRLVIGHYVIAVRVTGEAAVRQQEAPVATPADFEDLWRAPEGVAPPADPREFAPAARSAPVRADFLEWAVDIPDAPSVGFVARAPIAPLHEQSEPASWDAGGTAKPLPVPGPPPTPTPRRSLWVSREPSAPWDNSEPAPRDIAAEPVPPAEAPRPPGLVVPPPRIAPAPPTSSSASPPSDILERFARGAGLPAGTFGSKDPGEFIETFGRLIAIVTENVKHLLGARSETRRIARSSNQTMIAALNNNPLKFSPTATDALKIMLGPPTSGYLDAEQTLRKSFDDLKTHQMRTFSAMQHAMRRLLDDLSPESIEDEVEPAGKIAAMAGRRDARLWQLYKTRWAAKAGSGDSGMDALFMQYFTEFYDGAGSADGGSQRPPNR